MRDARGVIYHRRMAEEPTVGQNNDTIDALMAENRKFPPSEEFKAEALVTGTFLYDEAAEDDEGVLGAAGRRLLDWAEPWHTIARLAAPERQVVRRRHAQRRRQLPRPPRARRPGRQGRHPLGRRAGRHPHDHVRRAARRGVAVRQRPQGARRRQGRSRQHLPADDPRGGGGDARLRPHRRPAQRGVRRVLGAGARRSHQRRRGQGADHRRRRLPARRGVPAQGRPPTRRARRHPDDRARRGRAARRQRRRRWSRAATTGTTT